MSAEPSFRPRHMKLGILTAALQELTPRAVRDAGWAKLMADPRMASGAIPPFDGKRLIYGGFEVLLNV